jgi:acetyl-CoA acetyltransferase
MTKFGRFPEKTVQRIAAEAVIDAIKDAGIRMKDIEMVYSGGEGMRGQQIMKEVGMTGVPCSNIQNACATGSTAFREAYFAIACGACDIALAVGSEQMGKAGLLGAGRLGGGMSPEGVLGSGLMPSVFGMNYMQHMRKYGSTLEQLAKISVKNHKNGCYNPRSQYQIMLTVEDVLNSRMISYPHTLYMCCPTGDGGAAAILCSMDKARQYTTKPVKIAGSGLASDPYGPRNLALADINTTTRNAAKQAYEQAGLGPEDLDLVELHDCFAGPELLHYENLGLCAEGEGGRMIDEGLVEIGGKIPVNVSGGLLAKGHPISATGVANICEIVWQLRGEAQTQDRQIPNAKVGLAHTVGMGTASAVHILTI